ncbi:MAG: hypothetical protein Q8J69_06570 [Sphingobacteriaceae bacterium]|nr:hypothetical protein [Sphingobacteriaceae bacterium]
MRCTELFVNLKKGFLGSLVATVWLYGCIEEGAKQKEPFNLHQHYTEFSKYMAAGDTLNVVVNLSVCKGQGFDQLQLTKSNDSLFIEFLEKMVNLIGEEERWCFPRVYYPAEALGYPLESMFAAIDSSNQEAIHSSLFLLTSPAHSGKVLLRTKGLGHRLEAIEKYQDLLCILYPKEMADFQASFEPPPPPPTN